jgi:hypothetical protein
LTLATSLDGVVVVFFFFFFFFFAVGRVQMMMMMMMMMGDVELIIWSIGALGCGLDAWILEMSSRPFRPRLCPPVKRTTVPTFCRKYTLFL